MKKMNVKMWKSFTTGIQYLIVSAVFTFLFVHNSFSYAAITAQEFATIRSMYPDLKLSSNMSDYTITEITTAQLSEANLRNAIIASASTPKPHLIVVRTDNVNHTITLSGTELGFPVLAPGSYAVNLVSFGSKPLTINANNKSRIFSVTAGISPHLAGLVLTGGNASQGGAVFHNGSGDLLITECEIRDNIADVGGGLYISSSGAYVMHSSIHNNIASDKGGGLYSGANFKGGFLKIFNNSSIEGGGAYAMANACYFNSLIYNNTASMGGGLHAGLSQSVAVCNLTITKNSAVYGGGVATYLPSGSPGPGNGFYGASFIPVNCIIAENTGGGDVFGYVTDPINCLIGNSSGWNFVIRWLSPQSIITLEGSGNIYDVDPLFVNSALLDFHLLPNSPAIDNGSKGSSSVGISIEFYHSYNSDVYDLDDNPRIVGTIDIGCYEFQ
ncbi:MAG: hypothetical protein FWC50_14350 [Planctomycetaceae bacterium]|nr:hypothetical protein [Planctomycetaceae bacterium]